jgi:hypothetical protein
MFSAEPGALLSGTPRRLKSSAAKGMALPPAVLRHPPAGIARRADAPLA